jgi:hypothetical protein
MEPTCFDENCIAWGYKNSAQVGAGIDCPDESLPPPYSPANAAAASAADAAAAAAADAAAAAAAGNASFDSASATAAADVNAEVLWQKNIQILIWVVSFLLVISALAYVFMQTAAMPGAYPPTVGHSAL